MDTFRLKLKEYLEERGVSVYALIQASGLAPNTAYSVARDPSANVRLDTIAAILTGLRRLTGEDVTLSDIVVHEPESAPTTGIDKVRAAPESPESGPTPDDSEWLAAFLAAAEGQSTSAPPYDPGSVVLVRFDGQVRPCVILSGVKRESQICGIVPLTARAAGGTTSFDETVGGLPASSTALCSHVQTVDLARVGGYVGQLKDRDLKKVRDSVTKLLALERAADGRYKSQQQGKK